MTLMIYSDTNLQAAPTQPNKILALEQPIESKGILGK